MSVQLLDRTRRINKLLHNNTGYKISISEICELLGKLLHSDVVITDHNGKLTGIYKNDNIPVIEYIVGMDVGSDIEPELNERFMSVLSTKENVNLNMMGLEGDNFEHYDAIIIPIDISGERLGTIFAYRLQNQYEIDDIILGEYAATIVAMEMLHDLYEEGIGDNRKEEIVKSAIRSLSSSELMAAKYVLDELSTSEGIIITSHVSDKYGITRSIIINAIKKLNSAGVIKSKSMGIKGTFVHIENDYIIEAVSNLTS